MLSNIFLKTNNPANIRFSKENNWLGQCGQYKGFCKFLDIKYGVRCLIRLITNYVRLGYDTITKIISKFAPSSENDTNNYIKFVLEKFQFCGYSEFISRSDLRSFFYLCHCICFYETGYNLQYSEFLLVLEEFDL